MQDVEWQSIAPNIMSNQDVYVESEYVELDEHYESLERDEITDKEDGQLSLITEDCESTGILESTSSSDESESETKDSLKNDLAKWAVDCNIALTSVTKLLGILRNHQVDVPAQAVTLLQTPRTAEVMEKSGGDYMYFGLKKGITNTLSQLPSHELETIELSVNIDGLPVYKSKNSSLWPIQCIIANLPQSKPFIAALFYSSQKPQNLNFLTEFVEELKELMENGITVDNGCIKSVLLKCFVCDAPAKALIKGTVQFNGRYGCDYCEVRGQHNGMMSFLEVGKLRTDKSFRERTNPQHHKNDTPLEQLNIDMINQFPIDPMHCVDLGVTKKLMLQWKEGILNYRLSAG